jgi:branched-chain amino acid transport system substrate-binding protein
MVGETQAMSSLILDVEQMTKAATPNALTKVAMVHKGDSFGKGSAGAMQKSLVFNGLPALDQANQPNFQTLNYGDSGNPTASPLKYPETAAKLLEQKPRIIVSLGTGELLANIVQPVEAGWDPQAPRPYWIFAHPQFSGALTSFLNANDASGDLRKRILGATPGTEDANYQQFKANYATQVNDGTDPASFGCSNTYDGLYVAAFAAASLGGTPITGRSLASAIPKLVGSGQAISVGSNDLNQALSALSGGGTINLNGVSGPLDFDLATGDVKQPIQIWCIPADAAGKPKSPKTSGYSFGTDGTTPVGTFGLVKSSCAL